MVAGCNAAGKSSFIRSRLDQLEGFEIVMTDVYKGRSKEIVSASLKERKNIILETVFNDSSFKDLVDQARDYGYDTSLIVLFLDTPKESMDRVAARSTEQNGLMISGNNVKLNFNESFKNVASYYFYFDESDFVYTGITGQNNLVIGFAKTQLMVYRETDLTYPQSLQNMHTVHND